jgi:hypothetical protein
MKGMERTNEPTTIINRSNDSKAETGAGEKKTAPISSLTNNILLCVI